MQAQQITRKRGLESSEDEFVLKLFWKPQVSQELHPKVWELTRAPGQLLSDGDRLMVVADGTDCLGTATAWFSHEFGHGHDAPINMLILIYAI